MFLSSTPAGSAGAQKLTTLSPSQHSWPFIFAGADASLPFRESLIEPLFLAGAHTVGTIRYGSPTFWPGEPLASMLVARIRFAFPPHSNPSAFSAALISSARSTGGSHERGS